MLGIGFRRRLLGATLLAVSVAATAPGLPAHAATPATFLITPTALDFGDVPVGTTSPQQTITIKNVSGAPVVMNGAGGAAGQFGGVQDCQGTTLAAGASCHMFYAFTPTALGPASGTTSGTWNGQTFNMSFTGNGVARFRISPTSFDFGDVTVGTTSPEQAVTVTNVSSSPAVMNGAGGAAGQFGGVQDCQGTTLAAGASCHMFYAFSPSAPGPASGSTSGTWNGQAFNMSFKGNGVARATFLISPTAFDFGDVTVGATSPEQTVTITNVSGVPQVMNGAGGAAGQFGGVQDCQGTTLAAGASCHMFYAFTPAAAGPASGSTSGTWNGQSFSMSFTGNGVARKTFLISPTSFDFGDVTVGTTSPEQTVTITNVSSTAQVMNGAGGAAGQFGGVQDCQGTTLNPGASCHMFYAFTPGAAGPASGTTSGTWNGQAFSMAFKGNGVAKATFLITPTSFDFGDVRVCTTSAQQTVTVTNVSNSAQVMNGAGGAAGDFGGVQDCQGTTLNPGDSCHMFYAFTPPGGGQDTGTTSGTWNGQSFSLAFMGNGVDQASPLQDFLITPTALDFGDVTVGTTSDEQFITVTNVSSTAQVMSGAGGGAGKFGGVQDCQGTTLNPGDSCHMFYAFTPSAGGALTGTTSGTWNGQTFNLSFKGNGILLQTFLISPTSFDFGDVNLGSTSPEQTVTITNVSSTSQVMNGAGGGAGQFGGVQDCQGNTLNPGDSCHMFYAFTPGVGGPASGTTSGTWNGQTFSMSFQGNGIALQTFLISPTALDFGDVNVGTTSPSQTVTITNVSSTAQVMNGAGGGAGQFGGVQDCQGNTLNPGDSCHLFYAFTPGAAGPATGTTSGTWNGQAFSMSFHGNGIDHPALLISPTAFDFGDVTLGSTSPDQTVTITNISGSPMMMSGAGGGAGQFGGVQDCQGNTLNPGDSCHMFYAFTPTALGAASGTTSGTWNGQAFNMSFKGNGIRQFLITPTGLDFGDVPLGTTSASQTITITNLANKSVVMNGAGGGAGQFGGVQDCQGNTLGAGASCHMFYAFTPAAPGPVTGNTSGTWNGQSFAVTFMGNGAGDNTPPVISFSVSPASPDGSNGWYRTAPTVTWTVTDPDSAITSKTGCDPTTVSADTPPAGLTLTCTATSGGGTSSASVVIKHDGTGPVITCPTPPTFALGSTASLTATVADSSSGPATPSVTVAVATTPAGPHAVPVQATDIAGNTSTTQCQYLVGFVFGGFIQPAPGSNPANSGSNIPVIFTLTDASGAPIPDADAAALAGACAVKVTFSATPGAVECATYDPVEKRFHANIKTDKELAPGAYQIGVVVTAGGSNVTAAQTTIQVR